MARPDSLRCVRPGKAMAILGLFIAAAFGSQTWAGAAIASDTAVDGRYTPAFQRCLDSSDGASTVGQIDCIGAELKIQDGRLNLAYAKAMRDLNARQKARLQAAQRAWIAFRDADCASMQDEDWGTLSRVIANSCVLERTVQRTIELEAYPPGT